MHADPHRGEHVEFSEEMALPSTTATRETGGRLLYGEFRWRSVRVPTLLNREDDEPVRR